jgi:hypothetical protein
LFAIDWFLQQVILLDLKKIFWREEKQRFTARIIWADRSLRINRCWKKSLKLMRRFGSRCNKPSSRLRQSGEIRASLGIFYQPRKEIVR